MLLLTLTLALYVFTDDADDRLTRRLYGAHTYDYTYTHTSTFTFT